jgi:hypothetical protein
MYEHVLCSAIFLSYLLYLVFIVFVPFSYARLHVFFVSVSLF